MQCVVHNTHANYIQVGFIHRLHHITPTACNSKMFVYTDRWTELVNYSDVTTYSVFKTWIVVPEPKLTTQQYTYIVDTTNINY